MSSYSRSDLETTAKKSGFLRDNLEKVIRLSDLLRYFNKSPLLAGNLALKGGTAINLTIFNLPRLSVDIDFDFTKKCKKEEMLITRELINQELLTYMFTQGYTLSPNTKNPHSLDSWAFYYQNAVGNKDNIKIEINYSMREHILPPTERNIDIEFIPSFSIRILDPLELFGSKIKALIERTAARDLYDVYNMIDQSLFPDKDLNLLRRIIIFYLSVGGSNLPKTKYSFEAIDKLKYPQIRANLIPVLRKTEHFNFEKAKDCVKEFLSKLMIFSEQEKSFIENFNHNLYSPELLFDNKEIVNRIKEHPMAMWKTRKKENTR